MQKTISVLGCGWYGLELAKHLLHRGHLIKGSTTSTDKLQNITNLGIEAQLVNFEKHNIIFDASFFQTETLVVCIPPKSRDNAQESFPDKIDQISKAASAGTIKNILFISSTAVYAENNKEIYESDEHKPETLSGKAMADAEKILREQNTFKTTILRFGGLIGPGREPGRFFANKINITNGQAPVNLIHLLDCIGISTHIIENEVFGHTYNACTPHHPSRQDFYTQAAVNLNLTPPVFIDELKNWKIVNSNLSIQSLKYKYQITNWLHWLEKGK